MSEFQRPKILVDTREKETNVLVKLLADKNIDVEIKSGGSADYVIIDRVGNQWGVERKSMIDCYSSIIGKEENGGHRIYGQLAELIKDYDGRAVLLLENPGYIPKTKIPMRTPIWTIHQMVYTFFSERSFVMPCLITKDSSHTAYLLAKLAKNLHNMSFRGRGYKISIDDPKS